MSRTGAKLLTALAAAACAAANATDVADFVDTRIGTGRATGSNVLGPCVPHGSAHPSPDSLWPSPHEKPKDARHGFGPPTSGWWPGGKVFAIRTKGKGDQIKSVTLNGKAHDPFFLHHSEIVSGGELVFELTNNGKKGKS